MERMLQILFADLLFMTLFVPTSEDNKLHYIIPDLQSNSFCSRNQSCLPFQHFKSYIYREKNVTMIFLKGPHTLNNIDTSSLPAYFVDNKNLTMMGTSTEEAII